MEVVQLEELLQTCIGAGKRLCLDGFTLRRLSGFLGLPYPDGTFNLSTLKIML